MQSRYFYVNDARSAHPVHGVAGLTGLMVMCLQCTHLLLNLFNHRISMVLRLTESDETACNTSPATLQRVVKSCIEHVEAIAKRVHC